MGVFRKLLFIGHILVLLLLLGASLNAYIPPSKLVFLNLLSLIFPILLIVHAVFTLFWLISRRNRISKSAAGGCSAITGKRLGRE